MNVENWKTVELCTAFLARSHNFQSNVVTNAITVSVFDRLYSRYHSYHPSTSSKANASRSLPRLKSIKVCWYRHILYEKEFWEPKFLLTKNKQRLFSFLHSSSPPAGPRRRRRRRLVFLSNNRCINNSAARKTVYELLRPSCAYNILYTRLSSLTV